ncbi:hypothetical protein N7466_005003 [Penicillium verhagenii]|uniref:uncharacterized protein n=1 Tax=Penicillium verhagenii TaxID=1562060 RepID=UPI002545A811|nr:uncharacterized protein N7466_005003 [Penicillium verhagenii]KAJ5935456.1 hypothetical protein N7466_005003 [Penicillium verhagenii]
MTNNAIAKDSDDYDPETQPLLPGGNDKFQRLGWKRLTIIAIVEAIALGSLGLPSAFAALGMVPGIILTVSIGLVAMYAGYIIGQVKLAYPEIAHYADVGHLIMGKWGSKIFVGSFVALLVCVVGSHALTGAIAFRTIAQSDSCSVFFSIVSAVILMLLAIPPSFAEIAILGYIDFASIVLAIGVTMVATGIQSSGSSDWSAWPKPGISFTSAIVATNNIVFAYSFAGCLPSFMEDMHTPEDYTKAMWWLGGVQIVIYTLTGSIIYAFVGQSVQSPALLSAGPLLSRVVFGLALPVIFISGSINITVVCRYIHGKMYQKSIARFINTPKGWVTWLSLVLFITVVAWIIAEAIPIFSDLLSIISSLFVSGLSFYFPPVMWYMLLREGAWYEKHNLKTAICNGVVFVIGMIIFCCGTYASIADLVRLLPSVPNDPSLITSQVHEFQSGSIGKPFTCSA